MPKPDERVDLFEVMYSCRAMRRLKPDPVPEDVLEKLIDAAVQCPSGSNAQNWTFVIVRDRAKLREIQKLWRSAWGFYAETINAAPRPGEEPAAKQKQDKASQYMIDHLHEVPAMIFVGVKRDPVVAEALKSPRTVTAAFRHLGLGGTVRLLTGGSRATLQGADGAAYPAVQNILLSARALGLGAVLTTPHLFHPGEYEKLLGIPGDVTLCAAIPVGYPIGRFGPVRRPRAADVISWDSYRS